MILPVTIKFYKTPFAKHQLHWEESQLRWKKAVIKKKCWPRIFQR